MLMTLEGKKGVAVSSGYQGTSVGYYGQKQFLEVRTHQVTAVVPRNGDEEQFVFFESFNRLWSTYHGLHSVMT